MNFSYCSPPTSSSTKVRTIQERNSTIRLQSFRAWSRPAVIRRGGSGGARGSFKRPNINMCTSRFADLPSPLIGGQNLSQCSSQKPVMISKKTNSSKVKRTQTDQDCDLKDKHSTMERIRLNCTKSLAAIQQKDHPFFQGHITRSVLPARMPLPRFYRLASSWMQGTADSRSSRKFLCDTNYNQGWYKRESIFFL